MLRLSKEFWKRYRYQSKLYPQASNFKPKTAASSRSGLHLEFRFFVIVGLCLIFYFIAANIGSGWIYLLSAALATVLAVGLICPLAMVNSANLDQTVPSYGVAGQPLEFKLKLTPSLVIPVYWLRLAYEFFASERADPAKTLVIENLIEPKTFPWTVNLPKRGVHQAGKIIISSSFPLGIVWAKRVVPPPHQTITVYPRTIAIDGFFLYKLNPSASGMGGSARRASSARQSTYTRGVREYVRGDSPRIVHWASSARTGRLLVREFEAEGLPQFDVLLDLSAPWQSANQFELAVTTASSLLTLGNRLGLGPQLILHPQVDSLILDIPPTPPGMQYAMEILARVKPVAHSATATSSDPEYCAASTAERSLVVIRPSNQQQSAGSFYLIEIDPENNLERQQDNYRQGAGASLTSKHSGLFKSVVCKEEDLEQL